ncbi:AMP-binding protein [Amycolatopsis nigrescens]|uniref:AMP-binding protein n=1 Tax=Amycolatopsis nigrescens TaxID=381445 RepID=UPI00036C609F|nr:AMP-binding protein [Amycolatopsis nigrescens]
MQPTPLGTKLAQLAEADPDRAAVTCGAVTLSRRELDLRSNALAREYAARGVGQDSLVTIGLPNGVEFILAALAAWKLGATPQPVSFRLPEAELTAVLELADPDLVVGLAAADRAAVPAEFEPGAATDPLPPAVAGAWKAPTSGGSTGRPKVILAGHPACAEVLELYANLFGMPENGVHLVSGPLYHNAPFMMSAAALFAGNHVVVLPKFDPAELLRLIGEHGVDWTFLVPTMMHRIWRLPAPEREAADVSSLRVVLHGAAPCPPWLKRAWLDWLGPERVHELYASTEAQAGCLISGTEWLEHPGSVGRVRQGEMRILDDEHQDVPTGEVGEIWMRPDPGGPLTYRYLGDTATTLPGGWESQGDLGRMDADGYLYLADRKPDMILVGGSNVFPAEVEAALDEHPAVLSSCVIGLPDDDYGNLVHAVVQVSTPVTEEELLAHLRERLVSYKLPRRIEFVDRPLRDEAGKIRRAQVRAERLAGAS